MGKRGPEPKSKHGGKTQVLSTRIMPDIRAKLDEAAKESGRPLSEEIARRLRRTFEEDERISDNFGDRQTYMLMQAIALAIRWQSGFPATRPIEHWLNDPGLFDQAVETINRMLEAIRPAGEPARRFDEKIAAAVDFQSKQIASMILLEINNADEDLPLNRGTYYDHKFSLLKSHLAEIAARSPDKMSDIEQRVADFIAKNGSKGEEQ